MDTQPDHSADDAETIAIQFTPAGSSTPNPTGEDGRKSPRPTGRKRLMLLAGIAALAVAALGVVLSLSGGGHGKPTSRQDTQIGDANVSTNGDQPGGGAGQSSSGQGAGGSGSGASTVSSSSGSADAPDGQPSNGTTTNPAQPSGSAVPSKPGQPSAPIAPSGNGNQPTSQPPGAKPPAYAGRLASTATQASSASTSVTLQTSAASSPGDALLLSVMLTNTHSGGVSASDSAGNTYSVIADQSDGAGDRTLILAATAARPLSPGASVTLTFPATQERHIALDDFTGVTTIGAHSSATAASGPFATGSASAPAGGIVFAAAGIQGGENATWSGGLSPLPTLVVTPADQLATAYETVTPGSYQASGSCNHQWMAAVVTLGR